MSDNKSFEDIIRDAPKEEPIVAHRTLESLKHVLSFRNGRRFVYDLLGVCHFGRSPFSGEHIHTTVALAGKQLVGEWVMDLLITTYPEAYGLMLKEAKEDFDHDRSRKDSAVAGSDSTSADHSAAQPN